MGLSILLALNAAYLVRLADQAREPGAFLTGLAAAGVFPFSPEAGSLSIEDYCPFGPLEGVLRFCGSVVQGDGLSFVGPVTLRNAGVLLALVALVAATKKTFCSWLCPFGALFDALGWIGASLGLRRIRPSATVDARLRRLRYAVLAAVVALTAWAGTQVFKEVDPFFALYSLGSEVRPPAAYAVLAALGLGALFLPGVWCHYLCPLGGFLDPFSRLGRVRVVRTAEECTGCARCRRACPQGVPVSDRARVKEGRCTNCLRCVDACPEPGALSLRVEGRS